MDGVVAFEDVEREVESISLLDSLDGEWLKLPLAIMQSVGPAVQTMGALWKITNRETFVPIGDIAKWARLPVGTIKKHLVALDAKGWINNHGRQRTRGGHLRRTATIAITKKTTEAIEPYGLLPWWACCRIRNVGKLPWSAKAVFSVVMARLCSLKGAAEQDGPDDDPLGIIENMGGDDRFRFSLDFLTRQTGLTRESVVRGKKGLHRLGVVDWRGGDEGGRGTSTDYLVPDWDFRVVVTPASPGRVWLDFSRGSENGL